MRATYTYGAGDVRVIDIPEPTVQPPTDALVRVVRACVCGSDLHPYHSMPADEGIATVRDVTAGGSRIVLEAVGHLPAYDQAVGVVVRPGGVISWVGVPQYEEAPVGFGSLFGRNITLTGGPAPARACIERLLPAVLDGAVNSGKVFDWTVQPGGHAEALRGNGRAQTGTLDPGCTARDGWPGREGRMLNGTSISLRPVQEADLDAMYKAHTAIANRGRYFPLGVVSESAFRRDFAEHGFWQKDEGTLLIVSPDGDTAGHIEFFRPVSYWDAFELSYLLYDERFSGHGWVTEAVQLLVDYLFATKKQQRIQLVIVPENAASIRIAVKCGFGLEGTARGAFFNDGRSQDVLIYSLLRTDERPWRAAGHQ